MDHQAPLRDITNQPDGRSGRGLKRSRSQTDAALLDDQDRGKIHMYQFVAKIVYAPIVYGES